MVTRLSKSTATPAEATRVAGPAASHALASRADSWQQAIDHSPRQVAQRQATLPLLAQSGGAAQPDYTSAGGQLPVALASVAPPTAVAQLAGKRPYKPSGKGPAHKKSKLTEASEASDGSDEEEEEAGSDSSSDEEEEASGSGSDSGSDEEAEASGSDSEEEEEASEASEEADDEEEESSDEEEEDSGDEAYAPPSEQNKHRSNFSAALRQQVIRNTALSNRNGHYVCPTCGRPLAHSSGKEIKTYYTSKGKGKRHNIKAGQLDHFPPWNDRLAKLQKRGASEAEIRADHDDPTRLRAMCRNCNQSHKYENTAKLPDSGYTDDEFFSDDDARDKEIWKPLRKPRDDSDDDMGGTAV